MATVHNLWIALVIGGLLTAFLWFNAPLLIQGAAWLAPAVAMLCVQLVIAYLWIAELGSCLGSQLP